MKKIKKGAASFYVVAFSTLILLIIAASFAAVIISEITRTSNDDLAQSAYDSALAGVEDAKLAFYNYRNCKVNKSSEGCDTVLKAIEDNNCNMVSQMLFRGDDEVSIEESSDINLANNMSQAYTCVKIDPSSPDYLGTLSQSTPIKVVKVKFSNYEDEDGEHVVTADMIQSLKVSWYSKYDSTTSGFEYTNVSNEGVKFQKLGGNIHVAAPPTIFVAVMQMGPTFDFDDFTTTKEAQTNRGMVYLVPTNNLEQSTKSKENNYNGTTYDGLSKTNNIAATALLKSNDKVTNNLPYMVYCDPNSDADFICSTTIDLPKPIGGKRADDNFYIVVGLPYGGNPAADFALEFFCATNEVCTAETREIVDENGNITSETNISNQANLESVQIRVDSTGRANDMVRRVEARLENPDNLSMSVMGVLELFGEDGLGETDLLRKTEPIKCEYNFILQPTC